MLQRSASGPGPGAATALTWAAGHADVELIRVLLAAGADPNVRHESGWTPLMSVVQSLPYRLRAGKPQFRWPGPTAGPCLGLPTGTLGWPGTMGRQARPGTQSIGTKIDIY